MRRFGKKDKDVIQHDAPSFRIIDMWMYVGQKQKLFGETLR